MELLQIYTFYMRMKLNNFAYPWRDGQGELTWVGCFTWRKSNVIIGKK